MRKYSRTEIKEALAKINLPEKEELDNGRYRKYLYLIETKKGTLKIIFDRTSNTGEYNDSKIQKYIKDYGATTLVDSKVFNQIMKNSIEQTRSNRITKEYCSEALFNYLSQTK